MLSVGAALLGDRKSITHVHPAAAREHCLPFVGLQFFLELLRVKSKSVFVLLPKLASEKPPITMVDREDITRATLGRSCQVEQLYNVRNDQVLVSFVTF